MAYFSSSNYEQYYDNYQFYQPYYNDNDDYDTQESRYVQYDYSNHTQYYNNEFQLAPTQPLVGYYCSNNNNNNDYYGSKNANFYENGDYYYDHVTTQFVISYNNNISEKEANDLVFEEYNPEPFHGGYNITETYGKALPPSLDICYPPTKINPNSNNLPLPYGNNKDQIPHGEAKPEMVASSEDEDENEDSDGEDENEDGKQETLQNFAGPGTNLVQEDNVNDFDEDEDEDEDEDDGKQEILQNFAGPGTNLVPGKNVNDTEDEDEDEDEDEGGTEDDASEVPPSKEVVVRDNEEDKNGKEIRRQIPSGYGMEAIDICEGLFGGYFPCLLKNKNRGGSCKQCGGNNNNGIKLRKMDDYECWQGTVDYFFGNPNPYGGSMPEKGSYGDPMFVYQRYYPQESIVGEVKYEENVNSSWLHDYSRYNYGYNGDY